MGNGGNGWVPLIGLVILGILTATGLVGGLILANNGHEVPPWLSSSIGGLTSNLGLIILVIYRVGGGNGNGNNGSNNRVAGPTGTSVSSPGGVKAS